MLRAVIEHGKSDLAAAFAADFETDQLRAFVLFMESDDGRPFGEMHAKLIAVMAVAIARGAQNDQADALAQLAMASFWNDASPAVRNATEAFLNSSDGAAWIAGLNGALRRTLDRYRDLLARFAEGLRQRRARETPGIEAHWRPIDASPARRAATG